MSKIKILILSINPRDISWEGLSVQNKLDHILELINSHFNNDDFKSLYENNNKFLSGIFILPEYTFSTMSNETSHQVDKSVKDAITDYFVKKLNIPGLLIIPGTIAYKNLLLDEQRRKHVAALGAFVAENDDLESHAKSEFINGIRENYMQLHDEAKSEYAKNSAYSFFQDDSLVKHKHSKREGLTDDFYDDVVFLPGVNQLIFECLGYKVGVSICRDALLGHLNSYKDKVDIEIVLSDFVTMNLLKRNMKYPHSIIHAATNPEHSGVITSEGMHLDADMVDAYLGQQLSAYTLNLPDPQPEQTPTKSQKK